jgi:hypothetical protein
MTEIQQRATAAGFLHALHTSPELFKEWSNVKKDDYAELGRLIQKTVGLSAAPTSADIHAMAAYIDGHLQKESSAFHEAHPEVSHNVGTIAMMQQS